MRVPVTCIDPVAPEVVSPSVLAVIMLPPELNVKVPAPSIIEVPKFTIRLVGIAKFIVFVMLPPVLE